MPPPAKPFCHPFKPPFRYEDFATQIVDAEGQKMLDVRGWGRLTGKGSGALGLPEAEAEKIQQLIGESTVQLLNKHFASDFVPCTSTTHDLQVICHSGPEMEREVVRWCRNCGAVVIDIDSDSRTYPGARMKMQIPTSAKPFTP